jgi:hypothetical protein
MFATVLAPPLLTGMMWSKCRFCVEPHWRQRPPSRAETAILTSCGICRLCRSPTGSGMWRRSGGVPAGGTGGAGPRGYGTREGGTRGDGTREDCARGDETREDEALEDGMLGDERIRVRLGKMLGTQTFPDLFHVPMQNHNHQCQWGLRASCHLVFASVAGSHMGTWI